MGDGIQSPRPQELWRTSCWLMCSTPSWCLLCGFLPVNRVHSYLLWSYAQVECPALRLPTAPFLQTDFAQLMLSGAHHCPRPIQSVDWHSPKLCMVSQGTHWASPALTPHQHCCSSLADLTPGGICRRLVLTCSEKGGLFCPSLLFTLGKIFYLAQCPLAT
jgi:hypothetical protein